MQKMQSRKFILSSAALIFSGVALYLGKMDGGTFVAALTVILGAYSAANVVEAKNGK